MSFLWLKWWTFCEIKWFECPLIFFLMPIHVSLFVVCLLVHTFVWIHVNFHVRMHNNQRDIGKLFHQHGFVCVWLTKLGSFCSFSILTLLHISKHCTAMQATIITSRVSFYREFHNLSDDIKHASIFTEIREQLLIKLRFPNFFWAVYMYIVIVQGLEPLFWWPKIHSNCKFYVHVHIRMSCFTIHKDWKAFC